MVIHFGTRLYGRVDVVPGVFHVATEFFHVLLVPLVPLRSWLVLKEEGVILPRFSGVRIPLSWKSVMAGWIRGFAAIHALPLAMVAIITLAQGEEIGAGLAMLATAGIAGGIAWGTPRLSQATFQRAQELVTASQHADELAPAVERIYKHPVRR